MDELSPNLDDPMVAAALLVTGGLSSLFLLRWFRNRHHGWAFAPHSNFAWFAYGWPSASFAALLWGLAFSLSELSSPGTIGGGWSAPGLWEVASGLFVAAGIAACFIGLLGLLGVPMPLFLPRWFRERQSLESALGLGRIQLTLPGGEDSWRSYHHRRAPARFEAWRRHPGRDSAARYVRVFVIEQGQAGLEELASCWSNKGLIEQGAAIPGSLGGVAGLTSEAKFRDRSGEYLVTSWTALANPLAVHLEITRDDGTSPQVAQEIAATFKWGQHQPRSGRMDR